MWPLPYQGRYREHFPDEYEWSFVGARFREAFKGLPSVYCLEPEEDRSQASNMSVMLKRLARDIAWRLRCPHELHRDTLLIMQSTNEGVREFAEWIKAREYRKTIPTTVRDFERASPAQLAYLRTLRCPKVPATMREASRLITEYKQRQLGQTRKVKKKGALYV